METVVQRIKMPSEVPYKISLSRPKMAHNGTGWHKVRGLIVPVDAMGRVAPHCMFYLNRDGLWYSCWVTAQWWKDKFYNALYLQDLKRAMERGEVTIISEQGMDYYEVMDMVKRAYGKSFGTTIKPLTPNEMYSEFGASIIEEDAVHMSITTGEKDSRMVMTAVMP